MNLFQQVEELGRSGPQREVLLRDPPPRLSKSIAKFGIHRQSVNRPRQRGDVAGRDPKRRLAVPKMVVQIATVGGNHGKSGSQVFSHFHR